MDRRLVQGNLLGAIRAEKDQLLDTSFVETSEYRAVIDSDDINFVVGRRGTGKTAIFKQATSYFSELKGVLLHTEHPREYEAMNIISSLDASGESSYRMLRTIAGVAWTVHLLFKVLEMLLQYWKLKDCEKLICYKNEFSFLMMDDSVSRCSDIIKHFSSEVSSVKEIPGKIASGVRLRELENIVRDSLYNEGLRAVFMFDGLDEGWLPTSIASNSVIGGLANAISEFEDRKTNIHGVLFLRDNMFRALAHFDEDASRHIEGNTIRLHWNEDNLFYLVTNRLRMRLQLGSENNTKIWNRFAARELKGREGFVFCLRLTLHRPRDILVLLNRAYLEAERGNRTSLVKSDIESTAKQVSLDRLSDLKKEYLYVFPGLDLFISLFEGQKAVSTVGEVVDVIDSAIGSVSYCRQGESDFALLENGRKVLFALFSVGFLGVENSRGNRFVFRHDGARMTSANQTDSSKVAIHPCYWRALDVQNKGEEESERNIIFEVYDDYETVDSKEAKDIRTRQLGDVIADLSEAVRSKSQRIFTKKILRIVKVLFSGDVVEPVSLCLDGEGERGVSCIVGRNGSQNSFWRRLENDYNLNSIQILPVLDNEIGSDVVRLLKEHHNIFDAAVVSCMVLEDTV